MSANSPEDSAKLDATIATMTDLEAATKLAVWLKRLPITISVTMVMMTQKSPMLNLMG